MIDLLQICTFNAAYANIIDSDAMEDWASCFTEDCHYRITNIENENEGLRAGIVYATSRAMLHDRVSALREANIYERQRYRHLIGMPLVHSADAQSARASTPFMVARIMGTGETMMFATGEYQDEFVREDGRLLLKRRVVVCDSTVTDTLLALPL